MFLPNAPYIATDVKWLGEYAGGSLAYDAVLIGVAAAIGLALGFVSLYLVQVVVAARLGRARGLGGGLGRPRPERRWRLPRPVRALELVGRA